MRARMGKTFRYRCLPREIERLTLELRESRQHVEREQQKAAGASEELLTLTERLGEAERQLHLTRLEKEAIQQSFSSEAKAQALQAQQREQELTQKMQQMEAQHDRTESEQYSLLTSQNAFLTKLKEECCTLAKKLEQISQKSRLQQLDQHSQASAQHLVQVLSRQNELLQERQSLSEEAERLRAQVVVQPLSHPGRQVKTSFFVKKRYLGVDVALADLPS
ncbi:Serologically defined colon cancer antigen 8 [Myotis davidii]|uniref:Serologically defined colon cancer antigen 8 n=1 Tax=Myotis davidii TaxID=225400 RepID=L5M990_MYODS|nr:Serologically defined colon cancer antigen 8 [Myotis davidii]